MHHPRTIQGLNARAERQQAAANRAGEVWEQGSYQVAKAVLEVADSFYEPFPVPDAAVPQADGDSGENEAPDWLFNEDDGA